jgi:hypothetical protein
VATHRTIDGRRLTDSRWTARSSAVVVRAGIAAPRRLSQLTPPRLSAFRFPHSNLKVAFRGLTPPARLLVLLCALAASGCGYTVGSPYRAEIRSVYVPTFTSGSNRRWLEYQLTESVQKQIQSRTHFRLANEGEADTKLIGRIVDANKRILGQTNNSDPRELQMNLRVEVTWEDARTGEILRQEQIPITPDAIRLAAQSELAPEVGQSMATGTREVVDRLARNIVDMMEAGW